MVQFHKPQKHLNHRRPLKAKNFIEQLRPTDHILFLYETEEAKHHILFNYVQAELKNNEATVYIATEETPNQIREVMKQFGINVERNEKLVPFASS